MSFDDSATVATIKDVHLVHQFAVYHCSILCHQGTALLQLSKCSGTLWLLVSVLLSGDVHANPSPIHYPCGICKKKVAIDRGLLCDLCDCWFHIICVNVAVNVYENFCKKGDFDLQCPVCLFSHLPSVATSSDSQDEDFSINCNSQSLDCLPLPIDVFQPAFTGLCVVQQNVQGLFSMMAEIAEWLHEVFISHLFCVALKHGFHVLILSPL